MNQDNEELILSEKDVPGASINGRKPEEQAIPQLKRWLQCRKASVKGKKANLVARWVLNIAVWMCVCAVADISTEHFSLCHIG